MAKCYYQNGIDAKYSESYQKEGALWFNWIGQAA